MTKNHALDQLRQQNSRTVVQRRDPLLITALPSSETKEAELSSLKESKQELNSDHTLTSKEPVATPPTPKRKSTSKFELYPGERQTNMGIKIGDSYRDYWVQAAMRSGKSMTQFILEALVKELGLPEGAVVPEKYKYLYEMRPDK